MLKKCLPLLTCIFMLWGAKQANAQSDTCNAHLKDATNNYEQGNFDDAIELLRSTIETCQLAKEDKISANKLLALCYLSIDNLESANHTAEVLLRIDPNYKPDKFKDDQRLIKLFAKYKPAPLFAIGINGGINFSLPHMVHNYSVVYPDGQAPASYKTKTGFQIGLQAERKIYKGLWAGAGAMYRTTSYAHNLDAVEGSTIGYTEKLQYADIPLSLKYYLSRRKLTPYIEAGADLSFLTSALSTTTRDDQKDIINRGSMRNTFTAGYFGGIGLNYRMKSFFFFATARYIFFPEDVNKAGTRYNDDINLYKYYYVDDDFTLDNIQLNAGVSYIVKYRNTRTK